MPDIMKVWPFVSTTMASISALSESVDFFFIELGGKSDEMSHGQILELNLSDIVLVYQ
jgi:hypothetical protein